jgi:hypothetical protein
MMIWIMTMMTMMTMMIMVMTTTMMMMMILPMPPTWTLTMATNANSSQIAPVYGTPTTSCQGFEFKFNSQSAPARYPNRPIRARLLSSQPISGPHVIKPANQPAP